MTTTTDRTAETVRALATLSATAQHAKEQADHHRQRLYNAVRFACLNGMSIAAAARCSGLDRAIVRRLRDQPAKP